MSTAIKKKMIPMIRVRMETTFSTPLSFVLTKTLSPPPVIAPEAPSDLPPWSKHKTMIIILTIAKIMSYQFMLFSPSCLNILLDNKLIYQ